MSQQTLYCECHTNTGLNFKWCCHWSSIKALSFLKLLWMLLACHIVIARSSCKKMAVRRYCTHGWLHYSHAFSPWLMVLRAHGLPRKHFPHHYTTTKQHDCWHKDTWGHVVDAKFESYPSVAWAEGKRHQTIVYFFHLPCLDGHVPLQP